MSKSFDSMDYIAHQAPVHGISQARIEEQVAFFSPGDLPNTRIEPICPVSTALADGFFTTKPPGKPTQHKTDSTKGDRYDYCHSA